MIIAGVTASPLVIVNLESTTEVATAHIGPQGPIQRTTLFSVKYARILVPSIRHSRAARVFVEFHQHRRATYLAEAAMRARRRLVERDKLLAREKAEIGGGDPRPRAEWRAMRLLALPAMAMGGSH
jgi:hypothetical protein